MNRSNLSSTNVGVFGPIVGEYLNGFAKNHYRSLKTVRPVLAPFFRFLSEQGILSLDTVTPRVITRYVAWWNSAERCELQMSYIKTFFKWAIGMGYSGRENPVISPFHYARRKKCEPRPYAPTEIEYIWGLLDERGDARARFAVAIAEEAGLRSGEICRLRVQDIDVTAQRCFVRLPNKTNTERYALFGTKTKRCFLAWMEERDPACGHDAVLYNRHGKKPCSEQTLTRLMDLTLYRSYLGKQVNETGLDRFNLHRLRHTMATNLVRGGADMITVMASGGWKSYDAACGYAATDLQVARRGYQDAMRRVHAMKQAPRTTRILTPAELLMRRSEPRDERMTRIGAVIGEPAWRR